MFATLCFLSCSVIPAQEPARGAAWHIVPRLSVGEELVYRGTYTEESTGRGVQFHRSQKLEHRVFVLGAAVDGFDAALLTIIKEQRARTVVESESIEPVSTRLELARVDASGRVTVNSRASRATALEGACPAETGAFIEANRSQVRLGDTWEILEEGRPTRTWKVVGMEAINGTSCVKIIGIQQSDDWDVPRGDRNAWRRQDTVWLAPNLGVGLRFQRVIEHREPARRDPSQRTVTEYSLENRMVYGQLAEDRRREIMLVHQLSEHMSPHLKNPDKASARIFDEALTRISQHMEKCPATPYRQAVQHVRRRIEAARRGEAVPVSYTEEAAVPPQVIAVGQPAPDFVSTDFSKRESARLRMLLGQPLLMVFYNPASRNAVDILKFAQQVGDKHVTVLGLAVTDDSEKVLQQRDDLKLNFPLLSGQGLKLTYAVEATPKFVVLDSFGIVRGAYVGWGRELPELVNEELARWKRTAQTER